MEEADIDHLRRSWTHPDVRSTRKIVWSETQTTLWLKHFQVVLSTTMGCFVGSPEIGVQHVFHLLKNYLYYYCSYIKRSVILEERSLIPYADLTSAIPFFFSFF